MKVNVTWSIDDNAEQAGKACAKKGGEEQDEVEKKNQKPTEERWNFL